jgi:hypothetical protein
MAQQARDRAAPLCIYLLPRGVRAGQKRVLVAGS